MTASVNTHAAPHHGAAPHRRDGFLTVSFILFLILILLATGLFAGWVFIQRVDRLYRGRVYPNVYALGLNLSGMTRDNAAAALDVVAQNIDAGMLILTDGEARWTFAWSEVGLHVDARAMAEEAYAVGRSAGVREQLSVWMDYHDVPIRFAIDAEATRAMVAQVAEEASLPPQDPTIRLENGEVVIVPGEAGRVVNVTQTLFALTSVAGELYRVEIPLVFETVQPAQPDTADITAQAEALLARSVTLSAYDVLTEQTLTWSLDRDGIAPWLHLVPGPEGEAIVDANLHAVRETLVALAGELDDGRGFRYDEAAQQVFDAFDTGGGDVTLYLTHPEHTYTVQSGDTLTSLSTKFGMPSGLVAEANPGIDYDRLQVGQQLVIPSQDVLTPYLPVPSKKIVVNIEAQRVYVYENGALLYEWVVSTGLDDSPTHRGTFQVRGKHDKAFASQWDIWMPYFVSVYPAGGGVENGFHELPILASGQRLWAGSLGHPASFGCIILGIPDAETLYHWAEVGVIVVIE